MSMATEHPPICGGIRRRPQTPISSGRIRYRQFLCAAVLTVCGVVLIRVFFLDAFQIPSGSMAPALLGHHRACACPRCGTWVQVGLPSRDPGEDAVDPRYYRRAWCPNCGAANLPLHESPVVPGQRLLVNKTA